MKHLKSLPDDIWDGDKNRIDPNDLQNIMCDKHDLNVDFINREATCRKCGYGFRFQLHEVKFDGGKLYNIRGEEL